MFYRGLMVGASFSEFNSTLAIATAYFNGQPYHTQGITVAMMDNALLRYFTQSDAHEIVTINHPLRPNAEVEQESDIRENFVLTFVVSITMMFGNYSIPEFYFINNTKLFSHSA